MQAEKRQMRVADAIVMEMDQEAEITRRLFNVIPDDKLDWRPHAKAKSLGELAIHIATIPAGVAGVAQPDVVDFSQFPKEPEATGRAQILEIFEDSLKKGKEIVALADDANAVAEWTLTKDGATVMTMPRVALWRSILLNHYYHHRGQLSTYLRALDVPLPSIYGPSADENPFA